MVTFPFRKICGRVGKAKGAWGERPDPRQRKRSRLKLLSLGTGRVTRHFARPRPLVWMRREAAMKTDVRRMRA